MKSHRWKERIDGASSPRYVDCLDCGYVIYTTRTIVEISDPRIMLGKIQSDCNRILLESIMDV